MAETFDVAIVGGGIVGLATARALLARSPTSRILVLEKEAAVGRHQTGHNSGVLHSGVYYRPGSAKARLCLRGRSLLLDYCDAKGIPYRLTGKLIVATRTEELPALQTIRERAIANAVPGVVSLTSQEIQNLEPEVRGIAGLEVPTTGIVDFIEVAQALARDVTAAGAVLLPSTALRSIERNGAHLLLRTGRGDVQTRFLANCAGLHADRIARLAGLNPQIQIIPFRGEFYWVRPESKLSLEHLIYPVPNPALPFLGVHLTLTIHGRIEAGPNAVLALAREGYNRATLNWGDMVELATFPGLWRMARRFWRVALYEQYRSVNRDQYSRDLRRLVPSLASDSLQAGGAGVRAQAVDRMGRLVDDFIFESGPKSLHVINAPSPAATSSLAIAEEIARAVPRGD
jgi:L-2-hydroxyglutarate oxidase LhgO